MAQDIILDLDNDGDLLFENGDFKVANSDQQHVILLVNTVPGSWKRYPLVGVGIIYYSASANQSRTLRSLINKQLEADGFVNIDVNLVSNEIDMYDYYINAERLD